MFCIRLPGRESCLEEPFAKDITSVVNEVISVLLKVLKEIPFAFFCSQVKIYTFLDNLVKKLLVLRSRSTELLVFICKTFSKNILLQGTSVKSS